MKTLENIFVITLFLIYLGLWKIKQLKQIKNTGVDPAVIGKSTSSIQKYFYQCTNILTLYAVLMIVLHSSQFQLGSLFSRITVLDQFLFYLIGFFTGLMGLSLCFYAQVKMGNSWRVGVDTNAKTDLITTGLYKYIRNPTYLGLFLLNMGLWLIWPTWTVFLFNLVFVLLLDIQVRCEEDYLSSMHGSKYIEYKKRTKRYIPFIY